MPVLAMFLRKLGTDASFTVAMPASAVNLGMQTEIPLEQLRG